MKKTEIILVILAIIAVALNLMLISGGAVFTTLILLTLSWIYLVVSFALLNRIRLRKIFKKESYDDIGALRIVSAILIGIALSTAVIGILFGLMTWNGAKVMLMVALCELVFFAILLLIEYTINKSDFYKSTLPRILVWGGLCLLLYLLPKAKILEFKYRNYPEYLQSYKNYTADPNNEQLREKMKQEREKMYKEQNN